MFYLTYKFRDNRLNTFGFMEGRLLTPPPPPQAQELQKSPGRIGLTRGIGGSGRGVLGVYRFQNIWSVREWVGVLMEWALMEKGA